MEYGFILRVSADTRWQIHQTAWLMNVLSLERANAILGPKWLFTLLVNFFFAYFFNLDMCYVRCLRNILRSSQLFEFGVWSVGDMCTNATSAEHFLSWRLLHLQQK